MKRFTKGMAALLILLMIVSCMTATRVQVYADDEVLPSGLSYGELDGAIQSYIKEHQATTVGLAWSVFDTQGDISAGYYGYADRENSIPVDEETVFEWGSGSKVLVWLCVMQLVEKGQLDLNADIKTYLPDGFLTNLNYDTTLTMVHLMNHTAGFQNSMADVNIDSPDYFTNLEEAISAHKPEQIYRPDSVTAYSNWGTSLAAYIIERVTGMEYADYVHQNIFEPLGMEHSALFIDLSDNPWVQNKRRELKCYNADGSLMPNDFNYVSLYPSGRCTSTFGDFAALAKAILNRDSRLMSAETWETLFTPSSYFEDTGLAKNYHGFWAVYMGAPAIGHIGKTNGCSSYLLVDPEDGIGSLFMVNQGGETVYVEGTRSLIYGDFSYSDYGTQPSVPAKDYRNSNTVTVGPFKFLGFYSALMSPVNVDGQYWKVSSFDTGSRLEFAYMDYTETAGSVLLGERLALAGYILAVAFLMLSLVCRIFIDLRRAVKKEKRPLLSIWSTLVSFLPVIITPLYLMVIGSTATTSNHYVWIFYAIGAITLCMVAMAIFGIVKTRKAELRRGQKVYNYAVSLALIVSVAYVCYWNMFMFWKL